MDIGSWKKLALGLCIGLLAISANAKPIKLKEGHPINYTIREGDTLWDIASKYLDDPLQWRELLYANPQIHNPNKIYPGEVLELHMVDGSPVIEVKSGGTVKLKPHVRSTPIDEAIPTIPLETIQPFLNNTRVMNENELLAAPYVIAQAGEHVVTGAGDEIFVEGMAGTKAGTNFSIFHPGEPYVDPQTKQILGYEAYAIGTAQVIEPGVTTKLLITSANQEVTKADRLIVQDESRILQDFTPHMPEFPIQGQIISVLGGVTQIGQYQVVVLNRGNDAGLQVGDMLAVYKLGERINNPQQNRKDRYINLPNQRAGELMVFRTFDRVSYGLILHATKPMHVLDIVSNPD